MMPTVNILATPTLPTTSFVANHTPTANLMHVPFTDVPPPVSNAQINNNAKGSSVYSSAAEEAPVSAPPESAPALAGAKPFGPNNTYSPQAMFLTQLLSQSSASLDAPNVMRSMLVEYDKLIVMSQTKYMPSTATMPVAPPSGLFDRILHQDNAPKMQPVVAQEARQASQPEAAVAVSVQAPRMQNAQAQKQESQAQRQIEISEPETVDAPMVTTRPAMVAALRAYAATSSRNALFKPEAGPDNV